MNSRLVLAVFTLLLSGMCGAQAQDGGPRGGFMTQLDLDFGGDDLATVSFEDGDSQDIEAGQGVTFSVGGWFRPVASSPFEVQALLGYKYTTTAAENADINVSRVVLALNGVYRFDNGAYLSAGLTHHASPELDGDGFFEDIPFDDATGFRMEVGWRWIGLHYTSMEYSSTFYENVDASSIGLSLTYRFGSGRGY
jgi:hypothetical protein